LSVCRSESFEILFNCEKLIQLQSLSIYGIDKIESFSFLESFCCLKDLSFSNCKLKLDSIQIPFSNSITNISMSRCNLSNNDINGIQFELLSGLKTLNLSNNNLSHVEFKSLYLLSSLERLILHNNRIEYCDFQQSLPSKLLYIDLTNNDCLLQFPRQLARLLVDRGGELSVTTPQPIPGFDQWFISGNEFDAAMLKALKITSVISVCLKEELPACLIANNVLKQFNHLWLNVRDDLNQDMSKHIENAIDFEENQCRSDDENQNLLIHCLVGVSRSSTIVTKNYYYVNVCLFIFVVIHIHSLDISINDEKKWKKF
jgi:hypothetical protein